MIYKRKKTINRIAYDIDNKQKNIKTYRRQMAFNPLITIPKEIDEYFNNKNRNRCYKCILGYATHAK